MNLTRNLNYILSLIMCLLPITICYDLSQIGAKDVRLLDILLSQNQTGQNVSRYPLKQEINYSTVNSKDEPSNYNQRVSQLEILRGINFLQHRHVQRRIQYLQQKQAQRRNVPIISDNDLRAIFLSKYSIQIHM